MKVTVDPTSFDEIRGGVVRGFLPRFGFNENIDVEVPGLVGGFRYTKGGRNVREKNESSVGERGAPGISKNKMRSSWSSASSVA